MPFTVGKRAGFMIREGGIAIREAGRVERAVETRTLGSYAGEKKKWENAA